MDINAMIEEEKRRRSRVVGACAKCKQPINARQRWRMAPTFVYKELHGVGELVEQPVHTSCEKEHYRETIRLLFMDYLSIERYHRRYIAMLIDKKTTVDDLGGAGGVSKE